MRDKQYLEGSPGVDTKIDLAHEIIVARLAQAKSINPLPQTATRIQPLAIKHPLKLPTS